MNLIKMFKLSASGRIPSRMALCIIPVFCAGSLAYAGSIGLTINPTFDPSLTTADQGAINAAISSIEANIASPNDIAVSIYFNSMTGGLGQSNTTAYSPSYIAYYNAYSAVATQPNQLAALASLGAAPTDLSPGNPVNGNDNIIFTSAEGRNLGFNTPGAFGADGVLGDGTYDSVISLNTSLTSPPNTLSGSTYSLQAVANHEIDEVLGIGGTGSTIGGSPTDPVGDLDLYRYSAAGVRSYSALQTNSPYSYFSIDGGTTALSYFNQTGGADYADWLSNPVPAGFGPQVQDAFGGQGSNPALGPNEITAFNVIGYDVTSSTPEPSTFGLIGLTLLGFGLMSRRQQAKLQ